MSDHRERIQLRSMLDRLDHLFMYDEIAYYEYRDEVLDFIDRHPTLADEARDAGLPV